MLRNFVSVYVPSTENVGHPLADDKRAALLANVATKLSQNFGGCTAIDGVGYWVANDGQLIPEKVTIVKSFYGDDFDSEIALQVITFTAREIAREYGQEAVTIETNEGIEFITAEAVIA